MSRRLVALVVSTFLGFSTSWCIADPTIHIIPDEQMRIDLVGSSVTAGSGEWVVVLRMDDDNSNPLLGSTFRRWWHVEMQDLNTTTGETLHVTVTNAGYSDFITPVWSLDGGSTYSRIPSGEGSLDFTVTTPPGIASVRLAKYFPYTLSHFDAFRATFTGDPYVNESVIGLSSQGRPIYMEEITDTSVSAVGKHRVWIHSCVHPSETTAVYTVEGLIQWLTSGQVEPDTLLKHVIFDIVPMPNPDGVALGNYRTTATSDDLEGQWAAPYDSVVTETVVLRTQIETFMGTAGSPGTNPIEMLLNLHASHNINYPFHYVHTISATSVSVNALEQLWVADFMARSAFVSLGTVYSSSLSPREYVESMMYDRYSSQPEWGDVMAITFEGTYQYGPGLNPNTPDDYRQVGGEMGLAIADFFGVALPAASVNEWMLIQPPSNVRIGDPI